MKLRKVTLSLVLGMILAGGVSGKIARAEIIEPDKELFKALEKMEMHVTNEVFGTNFKALTSYDEFKQLSSSEKYQKATRWYTEKDTLIKRTAYSPAAGLGYRVLKNDNLEIKDTSADLDSFIEETAGNMYAGTNVLDNTKSSVDQTLNTIEFNVQQTDTVSNATTVGMKIGASYKAKVNFLVAESEFTASAEFSANNTNTTTQTTTKSFKAPSQSIKVPAGKKYRVRALLNKIRGRANVNLYTTFKAPQLYAVDRYCQEFSKENGKRIVSLGGMYQYASDIYQYCLDNNLMEPSPYYEFRGDDVVFKGKGWVRIEQGTNFSLVVEDITPTVTKKGGRSAVAKQPKVVQTLTVKPQVSQN